MKNIISLIVAVALLLVVGFVIGKNANAPADISQEEPAENMTNDEEGNEDALPSITPISHATMVQDWNGIILYTDPVGGADAFNGLPPPDIILITDIHGDHLDAETLAAVRTEGSTMIAPQAVVDELPETDREGVVVLANGETTTQEGLRIEALPMYNLPESEESRHMKGRGNGYLIEQDGARVYVAGDTAGIPEMRMLENIDIAFIPMNLPYTMDVDEAADAVLDFAPRIVYPYHYRTPEGFSDVNRFSDLVTSMNPNIEVILLDWYPEVE